MQATEPVTRKPSKQRKRIHSAPHHLRRKFFAAPLSPELRKTYQARNLPVRRGDTVRVMRGDHKEFEGKITRVDTTKCRIYVEGLTREKVDGTTIPIPIHPSKVMLTKLNLDDKWRRQILERKKSLRKGKEAEEKPREIAAEKIVASEKEAVEAKTAEKPRRRKTTAKTQKEKTEKKVEKEEEKPRRRRVKARNAEETGGEA